LKEKHSDGTNHHLNSKEADCIHSPKYIVVVVFLAQAVFTLEAVVKIAAEGLTPWKYFTDRENGSWNCIDFLIVMIGFIELTPISFIFANFPVVILRLIRLFRVFKLAKALPRLRSIVEALMSSFSSVGWVCVLICSYNYIVGCFCVVFFRENVTLILVSICFSSSFRQPEYVYTFSYVSIMFLSSNHLSFSLNLSLSSDALGPFSFR
jgi:hypothetical protein